MLVKIIGDRNKNALILSKLIKGKMKELNIRQFLSGLFLVSLFGLVSCDMPTSNKVESTESQVENTDATYRSGKSNTIKGQYIIVFKDEIKNVARTANQMASSAKGKVLHKYEHAIKGFSLSLPDQASDRAIEAIRNNPKVKYLEKDSPVFATETQANATWGIDRSDQRSLPIDGNYFYTATGDNVTVYVIDTGINYTHDDFEGRASFGFDAYGGDGNDCDGHGTHVAGTIGGNKWGVAKDVNLVAVRVLDCNGSGTVSSVVAGVDWVTANATGLSVANMSLGGGASSTLDEAIENSISSGVTYVVAAGNESVDACTVSPARTPNALTIGATTSSDSKAYYSNYGSCVDMFAPGSGITSAWVGSSSASNTISGTSMAAPHVAGAAALYLQSNTTASPSDVESAVISISTKDIVTNSNTSNNHLLYTIFDDSTGDGGGSNAVPVADFTYTENNLNVNFNDQSTDSDGSITSWSWDFGDGATSSSQNPSHTYSQGGSYSVSLTVTDDAGDSDSVSKNITVNEQINEEAPVIDSFNINPYKTGPWNRADVSWTVSDVNSKLSSIKTELMNGTSVLESLTSSLSGGSASGIHEHRSRNNADSVRLTVTDTNGNSTTSTKNLDGSDGGDGGNSAPTADFIYSTDFLQVQFTDRSTDSDGSITDWSWNFGDGATSSTQNPSHTYAQPGTYTVTLTVTDDTGGTDSFSNFVTVEVNTGDPANISLTANGYKEKGRWTTDLAWSGATSSSMDIYRDGTLISTTSNSGSYTDGTSFKGGGTLTYQVCESGTNTCSDVVTVTF